MEKRAFVLSLALTLPLALYGIPYAYAASTQSTYIVFTSEFIPGNGGNFLHLMCSNPSDSTMHFAYGSSGKIFLTYAVWLNSAGSYATTGQNPNGWEIVVHNTDT